MALPVPVLTLRRAASKQLDVRAEQMRAQMFAEEEEAEEEAQREAHYDARADAVQTPAPHPPVQKRTCPEKDSPEPVSCSPGRRQP